MGFEITGPGKYRSRGGEEIVISGSLTHRFYKWTSPAGNGWSKDGRYFEHGNEHNYDIIGFWDEAATPVSIPDNKVLLLLRNKQRRLT